MSRPITDQTVNHHWSQSAYIFFISGLVSRLIKIAILYGWLGVNPGNIFAYSCLLVAVCYWLFWFLSELNEIIPRENHRSLFLRRRFSWSDILQKANLFELTYRVSVLLSIVFGFTVGMVK